MKKITLYHLNRILDSKRTSITSTVLVIFLLNVELSVKVVPEYCTVRITGQTRGRETVRKLTNEALPPQYAGIL